MKPASLFGILPIGLRDELLQTFNSIARNYYERRWEPAELNGGKLCEVVYTIVLGALTGTYANRASKPQNMSAACLALEGQPKTHPAQRSLRILIPRTLTMLYEVRNNRGVGHVGGEVDPNAMDAHLVYTTATWLVAELVRIFHGTTTSEAQAAVDSITEKKLPFIWQEGDIRRVLVPGMSVTDQLLLLLYGAPGWVTVMDLLKWTEYANPSRLRTTVLLGLHKARLLEYGSENDRVMLTPLGSAHVESKLLPKLA